MRQGTNLFWLAGLLHVCLYLCFSHALPPGSLEDRSIAMLVKTVSQKAYPVVTRVKELDPRLQLQVLLLGGGYEHY